MIELTNLAFILILCSMFIKNPIKFHRFIIHKNDAGKYIIVYNSFSHFTEVKKYLLK